MMFFTGRTTRAAINEIFDFGRPLSVTLVVLVERNGKNSQYLQILLEKN
jgi:pyrimidine operon attenuation protein/uracil phosphoribosyltransferase